MPIPVQRDLDSAGEALCRWWPTRLDVASEVELVSIARAAGAGYVNDTLLFELAWKAPSGPESKALVLRVQPSEFTVFYQAEQFFEHQYRLLSALRDRSDVPVPKVFAYEEDDSWLGAPFFVMERVEGRTQPDFPPYTQVGWIHDATVEQRRTAWCSAVETVAQINTLAWQDAGLGFLEDAAKPGLAARLDHEFDALEWACDGAENPIAESAKDWLLRHLPPHEEPTVLSWGDARLGNLIYRDFTAVSVIDWEMASLGPPLQDLGWWFFVDRALFGDLHSGDPHDPAGLPGIPSRDETLRRWQEITGFPTSHLPFYEVFAGFRATVTLQRMGALFKQFGVLPADSPWPGNNWATQALAPLIGVEHPAPEPMPALPT